MVIILQRENAPLMNADLAVSYDLGRRLLHVGAASLRKQDESQLKRSKVCLITLFKWIHNGLMPYDSSLLPIRTC